MDRQEMTALLAKLQVELESGQVIDEGLRQSLQALDRDIQRVLATQNAETALTTPSTPASRLVTGPLSDEDASLNERAQELEARFAAEHPYLASTLRDVMDRLGKMGI